MVYGMMKMMIQISTWKE